MKAERWHGVGIVETQIAITIGIGKRDDALATESAVSINQIGEALIFDVRLDWVFHGLLARQHRQNQKKQSDEILVFHFNHSGGKSTNFWRIEDNIN